MSYSEDIIANSLILTGDGSHTLYSPVFNEIYHSRHGAIAESNHVFLGQGLDKLLETNLPRRIFEVGFGTGLNALLTMLEADKRKEKLEYDTIELYPLPIQTIKELNYTDQLGFEFCYGHYHSLHLIRWDELHPVTPYFYFRKAQQSLLTIQLPDDYYSLVYFDAFAPSHQPELWTVEVFQKLLNAMLKGGILVTYCSKSIVRRNLIQAGFIVEKLPGPPGKREMLRAIKS